MERRTGLDESAPIASQFQMDLRISPGGVVVPTLIASMALGPLAEAHSGLSGALLLTLLGLWAVLAAAWMLAGRWPEASRWLTVGGMVAAVVLLDSMGVPGALPLLAIPTALTVAMVGMPAAAIGALGESLLLLAMMALGMANASVSAVAVALVAVWASFGVLCGVYHTVYQIGGWSWGQYQRAERLLEEARDRRGELRQALGDLAEANLQLTRLNRLADGLRQAAEEARRAKEQFVANVSHELRTPLNMIVGFSEMILKAPQAYGSSLPGPLLADLAVVLRNSQHLSSLIDDVLDLSEIEAGRMALTKERVALGDIIDAAVVAVRPLFESKGLSLEVEQEAGLPSVLCDPTRLRQVFLNLLSNAGRFTERGGVRVSTRRQEEHIVVSVSDTGPGIAAEDLGKIFQPFQQLDSSLRRRHGGSGLGLAISKSFVEMHGGTMWLESEKGSGSTFFFKLPIDPAVPAGNSPSRWFSLYWHYEEHRGRSTAPKVSLRPRLVVLETGSSLSRLLTRYMDGAEVVPVAGRENLVHELGRVPAQALLINGTSLAQPLPDFLRGLPLPYGMPVIRCSIPSASAAADALGVSGYLVKPVSRDALLGELHRLAPKAETLLLVDDEPEALQFFRRVLSSAEQGYRVLRASDGQQALNILRAQRPDALLLDLVMPEMDGFQLLAAKEGDPALRDIPTIVISARDPAGQPIVTNVLSITRSGGLPTGHLLECIGAVIRVLSLTKQAGNPAQ